MVGTYIFEDDILILYLVHILVMYMLTIWTSTMLKVHI